jgi:pantoate kinase
MSEAVCPAGISSFFEICLEDTNGKAVNDPARIGARGGGFAIARGARARVVLKKSSRLQIEILINSKPAHDAHTTRWALRHLLEENRRVARVQVNISTDVPIGAGYGMSAAGTAAACLALADAADLPVTYNQLGKVTHIAEVVNHTGLGTAAAVFIGGFVLVTEPGAPGIGAVDRLLFPKDHSIVCACLEQMPTREALTQPDIKERVNPPARRAMKKIRKQPELPVFLAASRKFGQEVGLGGPEITHLMDTMISAGAIGAAQNMIGKAVHGVVENSRISHVLDSVRREFPSAIVFASKLDEAGVRLATPRRTKTLNVLR